MLNQTVLVGRLVDELQVIETEEGRKVSYITLAVPRSYKNADGEYESDFIDVQLWMGIAENTAKYCNKGDLLGIKGRIETKVVDEKKYTNIIGEKVTFLSSKKEEEIKG